MKNSIKFLFAVAIYLGSSGLVLAQTSASTSVTEAATISQPIRLFTNTNLNFGGLVGGLTAGNVHVYGTVGTITIPGSGSPTAPTTTNVTYPGGTGPVKYTGSSSALGFTANVAAQVASLIVTGEPCLSYSISVSGGTTVSDNTFPGHTMAVVLDKPAGGNVNAAGTAGVLSTAGTDEFTIGGVLTVGAPQTSGLYTGSFNVTVAYN